MNDGRRLQRMTTGGSDKRQPETPPASDERWLKISKKRLPEVPTNESQRLRGMAVGGSNKWPEVPTNGGRRLQQMAVEDFEETLVRAGGSDECTVGILTLYSPKLKYF